MKPLKSNYLQMRSQTFFCIFVKPSSNMLMCYQVSKIVSYCILVFVYLFQCDIVYNGNVQCQYPMAMSNCNENVQLQCPMTMSDENIR